ncbi:MAG: hypothetical protein KKB02_00640 [Alphaproteobacteria bacterium]|nr:hypothetical protein [Alphaproteobacteria bacterium]
MKRTTLMALAALMVLGGCMSPADSVTGRADNDMLRFSSMNYMTLMERAD